MRRPRLSSSLASCLHNAPAILANAANSVVEAAFAADAKRQGIDCTCCTALDLVGIHLFGDGVRARVRN